MNQKGEVTLLGICLLVSLTGLMLLCALELERSFNHLRTRTKLLLCAKETKSELHRYLILMGRSNWALKNLDKAKWIMLFIPGMQGGAMNAEKTKKFLKLYQEMNLPLYLTTLHKIRGSGCHLDPRTFMTPFETQLNGYLRKTDGSVKARNIKWTYFFIHSPYVLSLEVEISQMEKAHPIIRYQWSEKKVRPSFLLSAAY